MTGQRMIDTELIVDLKVTVPLRVTDFDRYGRLKPSAVLALFQEAATVQANVMDIGHDAMERRGVFWAVIRTYYEVIRQPELYTSVQIRTWPHSPSRFSFQRDYIMSSLDGEVLVRGTSEWVLMSPETRQFVSLAGVYEPPENLIEERNFEKKQRKIRDFDTSDAVPYVVVPPYTAADINGHVNNSVYADYPFDAINPSSEHSVKSFQIDFRHEARTGDPLAIYIKRDDGMIFTKGVDAKGEIVFAARTEF